MHPSTFVRRLAPLAVLLAFCPLPGRAQTTEDGIKARLSGQPLFLRGFWLDKHLEFDSDGHSKINLHAGSFTESGMEVHKVKLSDGRLRLDGERVGLTFSDDVQKWVRLGSMSIKMRAPPDGDFDKVLTATFAPDLASLVSSMPPAWQGYAQKHFLGASGQKASAPKSAETAGASTVGANSPPPIGGSMTMPVVLQQPEPRFSSTARALKHSGNVEVYLWVLTDGTVSHLQIVKAAGLGLDEQALLAVSQYKFKPATKDGQPVKVDLYVDVNFQILR